jgi:hypothetical protein
MKTQGFLNAPSITEFRRGMRIQHCERHDYYVVEWVNEAGWAWCRHDDGHGVPVGYPLPSTFSLDLDSIWEGRRYFWRDSRSPRNASVLMVSPALIAYVNQISGETFVTNRTWFLEMWAPVPLPGPVPESAPELPVKVGDIVMVKNGTAWYIGKVTKSHPEHFAIAETSVGFPCHDKIDAWNPSEVNLEITKLVPADAKENT